jgi:hypothetical protein
LHLLQIIGIFAVDVDVAVAAAAAFSLELNQLQIPADSVFVINYNKQLMCSV